MAPELAQHRLTALLYWDEPWGHSPTSFFVPSTIVTVFDGAKMNCITTLHPLTLTKTWGFRFGGDQRRHDPGLAPTRDSWCFGPGWKGAGRWAPPVVAKCQLCQRCFRLRICSLDSFYAPESSQNLCLGNDLKPLLLNSGNIAQLWKSGNIIQHWLMITFRKKVVFLVLKMSHHSTRKKHEPWVYVKPLCPSPMIPSGLIPLSVHCDGAEFYRDSEFYVWSLSSILSSGDALWQETRCRFLTWTLYK